MTIKSIMMSAVAAITLISGAASAQPVGVPPGNDPDGYYSATDHNGYYDHNGTYRHIQQDRGYGPPPRLPRHRLLIMSKAATSRIAIAATRPPAPSLAPSPVD